MIHIKDYSTALFTSAIAFFSYTVRRSYFICANLRSFEFKMDGTSNSTQLPETHKG